MTDLGALSSRQDASRPPRNYVAVLPVKRMRAAKTRLRLEQGLRGRVALAFAVDTVTALLDARGVHEVVVVTDDPLARSALSRPRVRIAPEPSPGGLLAAVRHGRHIAAQARPRASVLVLPSDLPTLTGAAVEAVLREADGYTGPSFVPDASGTGTTFVALHLEADEPLYGIDSAARHAAAGFHRLAAPASARRDVDTLRDLHEAMALGVGARTRGVLRHSAGRMRINGSVPRSTASAGTVRRAGAMSA